MLLLITLLLSIFSIIKPEKDLSQEIQNVQDYATSIASALNAKYDALHDLVSNVIKDLQGYQENTKKLENDTREKRAANLIETKIAATKSIRSGISTINKAVTHKIKHLETGIKKLTARIEKIENKLTRLKPNTLRKKSKKLSMPR